MPVEKVPSWIKQVLMPELNEMKGELKAIHTPIDSVEAHIGSLRNEMNVKFDSLEKRIPVIEKMAALELKIAELEKRLALA